MDLARRCSLRGRSLCSSSTHLFTQTRWALAVFLGSSAIAGRAARTAWRPAALVLQRGGSAVSDGEPGIRQLRAALQRRAQLVCHAECARSPSGRRCCSRVLNALESRSSLPMPDGTAAALDPNSNGSHAGGAAAADRDERRGTNVQATTTTCRSSEHRTYTLMPGATTLLPRDLRRRGLRDPREPRPCVGFEHYGSGSPVPADQPVQSRARAEARRARACSYAAPTGASAWSAVGARGPQGEQAPLPAAPVLAAA
jgi:hypothetical protein